MLNHVVKLNNLSIEQLEASSVFDIHMSILASDEENLSILIKNLSKEKLNSLISISSWEKDNFIINNFSSWISNILSMDFDELGTELNKLDENFVNLYLSKVTTISWYDKDEIYNDNPVITDDLTFLIRPKGLHTYEDEQFKIAVSLIKNTYLQDPIKGRKICLDAMAAITSILEEECFNIKNVLLSQEGIPSYYDAIKLYFYEKPNVLLNKILKYIDNEKYKKSKPLDDFILSQYTVVSKDYFDKNFSSISKELEDLIKYELSNLISASIVVNNALNKDSSHILGIISRSMNYYTLGLELINDNTDIKNSKLLQYVPLKEIFRLGFSILVDIKRNANKLKAVIDEFDDKILLSNEDEEFINSLLKPIPGYFKDYSSPVLEFNSLNLLKEARFRLSELAKKFVKV